MALPAWLIGLGSAALQGGFSALEASRNRKFQERMSSTAHQREVADLTSAGLNPIISARMGGASTPTGSMAEAPDIGRGVATALAVKQAKAQIELTEAQADRETAQSALAHTQAADISTSAASGRYELIAQEVERGRLDNERLRELLPTLIAQAKAELQRTRSDAKSIEIGNRLDELSIESAKNVAAFEKAIGTKGPWAKLLFEALRAAAPYNRR